MSEHEALRDVELVQRARQGDLDAFNALVEAYQRQVYRVAYRLVGDPDLAEDVAQETFLSAWKGLSRFRGGSFRAWILQIAANAARDLLRRQRRRPALSLDAFETPPPNQPLPARTSSSPEAAALSGELAACLEAALRELPEPFRAAVILRDVEGLTYQEIAQILDVPLGTVRSRIARGRLALREAVRRLCGELLPPAFRLEDEAEP